MKGAKQALMIRAAAVSLGGNIILFILKLTALFLVRSLAIATDLGITVAGLLVSIVLFHAVKVSNRPADLLHNYGYGKIEHVCEAVEGIVLIGIALVMSIQAGIHIYHPSPLSMPWLGFGFSMASVTVNFFGAAWIFSLASKSRSPAVKAEGLHYRLEGYISLTIAAAFLAAILLMRTPFGDWAVFLDPAATMIVSVWIIFPSFQMAKHAFFELLDAALEEGSKLEVMKQLGKSFNLCCEFRDVRSRCSGRKKFVECGIVLPRQMAFPNAYRISARIEKDLRDNLNGCDAMVRIIPCDEACVFHPLPEKCPYFAADTNLP